MLHDLDKLTRFHTFKLILNLQIKFYKPDIYISLFKNSFWETSALSILNFVRINRVSLATVVFQTFHDSGFIHVNEVDQYWRSKLKQTIHWFVRSF